MKINNLNDIDLSTVEGKLLFQAIVVLSMETFNDATPDDIIKILNDEHESLMEAAIKRQIKVIEDNILFGNGHVVCGGLVNDKILGKGEELCIKCGKIIKRKDSKCQYCSPTKAKPKASSPEDDILF